MIKTFLFDMGNVLVHFSHERMCDQMGQLCSRSGPEVREFLFNSGLQWNFERGFVSEDDFHEQFQTLSGQSVERAALIEAGSDIFWINQSLLPVLDTLKERGHRLVVMSNTSISHFQFVERQFDVLQKFDDFVLSYEVGAIKPEPRIYEAALDKIQCAPNECFYTDDISDYVATGRTFGLQAEIFTDTANLRQHLHARGISLP